MAATVTVTVATEEAAGRRLLAPTGIPTPYETPVDFAVAGATVTRIAETWTGQTAAAIAPEPGRPVVLTYGYADGGTAYPESLFVHRANRYTRAADDLARESRRIADAAEGTAGIAAIANDAAAKFTYGHPDVRFHDGMDEVPYLSCGLTEGSCVDINTFLIAALRAAGFEAGYVTGYFFPEEKQGVCEDMHCWVVTRHDGVVQEWDIAHHLKLGASEIRPGLNPKPGVRFAVGHSMGLEFLDIGVADLKLLAEPVWVDADGRIEPATVAIRCDRQQASETRKTG